MDRHPGKNEYEMTRNFIFRPKTNHHYYGFFIYILYACTLYLSFDEIMVLQYPWYCSCACYRHRVLLHNIGKFVFCNCHNNRSFPKLIISISIFHPVKFGAFITFFPGTRCPYFLFAKWILIRIRASRHNCLATHCFINAC